jgi:hypothetical protein
MNVPLNQIYNYLEGLVGANSTLIYRFDPPGSKKIGSLTGSKPVTMPWSEYQRLIITIMHDQEPLNFDLYSESSIGSELFQWFRDHRNGQDAWFTPTIYNEICNRNLGFVYHGSTTYDRNILVHSEKRSSELQKYSSIGLEPVYWWSHALIARDWYRYAEIDPLLSQLPNHYEYDFNVYNRAWSGTREYRLKFADLVIGQDLVKNCNITFNQFDNNVHYQNYDLQRQAFAPDHDLTVLPSNFAGSTSSADYDCHDYSISWFDVVLETLFDDTRLHLTEKILRPIACGKPFLLAATHGSLQYLRDYGFLTFDGLIDESYDLIKDPVLRLQALVDTMKKISELSSTQKNSLNQSIKHITEHNKSRFFSREFFNQVTQEFAHNYQAARETCEHHNLGQTYISYRKVAKTVPALYDILTSDDQYRSRTDLAVLLREIRKRQGR